MKERVIMTATLQKWGNSQGIRIPKQIVKDLSLKENDVLSIESVNDTIVFKKVKVHKSLKDRLEEFYHKPISKIKKITVNEIDTGKPVGEEIW